MLRNGNCTSWVAGRNRRVDRFHAAVCATHVRIRFRRHGLVWKTWRQTDPRLPARRCRNRSPSRYDDAAFACADRQRIAIALVALAIVLFAPAQFGTVLAILVGAISGLVMFRSMTITLPQAALIRSSKTCAAVCAVVLVALLVLLPIAGQITGRLDI
jgi:hypothetical protein